MLQNQPPRGMMGMPMTRQSLSGPGGAMNRPNMPPQLFRGDLVPQLMSPGLAALQQQRRITQEQNMKKMNAAKVEISF